MPVASILILAEHASFNMSTTQYCDYYCTSMNPKEFTDKSLGAGSCQAATCTWDEQPRLCCEQQYCLASHSKRKHKAPGCTQVHLSCSCVQNAFCKNAKHGHCTLVILTRCLNEGTQPLDSIRSLFSRRSFGTLQRSQCPHRGPLGWRPGGPMPAVVAVMPARTQRPQSAHSKFTSGSD